MTDNKKPSEGKKNPVATFLTAVNNIARAELPTVGGAVIALSIIAILASVKFISVEFMLILTVATIVKASFQAGMVWAWMRCRKEER